MLNVGPTRADGLPGLEKIELSSGVVLRDVVRAVLCVTTSSLCHLWAVLLISNVDRGTHASEDPVVETMLRSGVVKPPPEDGEIDS